MEFNLVLSLFPGIGLLDMAFEQEGFCVVRGPDLLWGGDIKRFHPPAGKFYGVIGGPPCQCFSRLARLLRHNGQNVKENLFPEFIRCVQECRPDWFLSENVPDSPDLQIVPYHVQSFILNNRWLGEEQNRVRKFNFGSIREIRIFPEIFSLENPLYESCVTASELSGGVSKPTHKHPIASRKGRSFEEMCRLQGLPNDFDLPFTRKEKGRAVGNGVPLPMGRAIAKGINAALGRIQGGT